MTREGDERDSGTPQPTRGSGEPSPERRPTTGDLDAELVEEAGALPRLDALDPGESGAGGTDAVVGTMRGRGRDVAEDHEAGGPSAPADGWLGAARHG